MRKGGFEGRGSYRDAPVSMYTLQFEALDCVNDIYSLMIPEGFPGRRGFARSCLKKYKINISFVYHL